MMSDTGMHPREDNNWYLHSCPITDIYTAARPPVQISVIAGVLGSDVLG